jgi:hypothetical protein
MYKYLLFRTVKLLERRSETSLQRKAGEAASISCELSRTYCIRYVSPLMLFTAILFRNDTRAVVI